MSKTGKIVVIVACVILFACTGSSEESSSKVIELTKMVDVPEGYTFVAASMNKVGVKNYYCVNDEDGRTFICNDGVIDREIIMPNGYSLVAVTHTSELPNHRIVYYCRNNITGEIHIFD